MEDDPIERSLKERLKAGSITEVVASKGAKTAAPVERPSLSKQPSEIDKKPNEKPVTGNKPLGSARPSTSMAKPAEEKKAPQTERKKLPQATKEDESDDPIAVAMALRIKAGGPTQVVPASEVKKSGLIKAT